MFNSAQTVRLTVFLVIENKPNPMSIHVGKCVRAHRNLMCFSQLKLDKGTDTTFQQLEKYGRAINGIVLSRL